MYILGGSINWLNIFVDIWQNLPKINADADIAECLTEIYNLSSMYMHLRIFIVAL